MAKKKASGDLVIVESPAKAKTIEKYLGEGFTVLSSYGHVRDLPERDLSVDVENGFEPTYIIPDDKKDRLKQLQKEADKAVTVWLATDEDRGKPSVGAEGSIGPGGRQSEAHHLQRDRQASGDQGDGEPAHHRHPFGGCAASTPCAGSPGGL